MRASVPKCNTQQPPTHDQHDRPTDRSIDRADRASRARACRRILYWVEYGISTFSTTRRARGRVKQPPSLCERSDGDDETKAVASPPPGRDTFCARPPPPRTGQHSPPSLSRGQTPSQQPTATDSAGSNGIPAPSTPLPSATTRHRPSDQTPLLTHTHTQQTTIHDEQQSLTPPSATSRFGASNLHQRDSRSDLFKGYTGGGAASSRTAHNASPRVGGGVGGGGGGGYNNGYSGNNNNGSLGIDGGAQRGGYRPATPNSRFVPIPAPFRSSLDWGGVRACVACSVGKCGWMDGWMEGERERERGH